MLFELFEFVKFSVSIVLALVLFLAFLFGAWYFFWKLFLSRFDFIRELFSPNGNSAQQANNNNTTNTTSANKLHRSRKD